MRNELQVKRTFDRRGARAEGSQPAPPASFNSLPAENGPNSPTRVHEEAVKKTSGSSRSEDKLALKMAALLVSVGSKAESPFTIQWLIR